jgi:methionyl-tRNA formyltransferase
VRLAFAGSPQFAAHILSALLRRHEVPVVYCQPPRPAGRGKRLRPSAVEVLARAHGIPVQSPRTLRTSDAAGVLAGYGADALVVAAYGLLLPRAILDVPPLGCINVHASLLPRWRGAAPVERALIAGDDTTGVCIMQMDDGLDTGPVIARAACAILPTDTGGTLTERLADLGASTLMACLQDPSTWAPQPQAECGITYAQKLTAQDSLIDWTADAAVVARTIRALNPRQPAISHLDGERVRFLFGTACAGRGAPGEILSLSRESLTVACGVGAVAITQAQLTRGKGTPLDAAALFNGYRALLAVGSRFVTAGRSSDRTDAG